MSNRISIGRFEEVYKQKMNYPKNREKRIVAIEDYFFEAYDIEVNFEKDKQKCLDFILQFVEDENSPAEEDVFSDIINVLEDRYSIGEPFFISSLNLGSLSLDVLAEQLQEKFSGELIKESFCFSDSNITKDNHAEFIKIDCKFTEFAKDIVSGQINRGNKLYSGNLSIYVDVKNSVVIVRKSSYNKAVNQILDFINALIVSEGQGNIKPYYAQHKARGNKADLEYDNLTLITINIILNKLNINGYDLSNVVSLSFQNNGAPRIKNAKLGGVDLFQDLDIVARILNRDRINVFSVKVSKALDDGSRIQVLLTVDFRGAFKILFDEIEGIQPENQKLNVIACEIYEIIQSMVTSKEEAELGQQIFEERILPNSKPHPVILATLNKVEQELKGLLSESASVIEQYFNDFKKM
ncbi:hypothetical protein SAMN04487920_11318 [Bacillus mycoides]|nr:hypothetical protein SAMN04487920_11318 [Bacillus mycoides]